MIRAIDYYKLIAFFTLISMPAALWCSGPADQIKVLEQEIDKLESQAAHKRLVLHKLSKNSDSEAQSEAQTIKAQIDEIEKETEDKLTLIATIKKEAEEIRAKTALKLRSLIAQRKDLQSRIDQKIAQIKKINEQLIDLLVDAHKNPQAAHIAEQRDALAKNKEKLTKEANTLLDEVIDLEEAIKKNKQFLKDNSDLD